MKKTSPPLSHHFVRGGQLNIHNLRMIKQVVGFSLLLSAFVTGLTLGVLSFKTVPSYVWHQYITSYKAEVLMLTKHKSKQHRFTVNWPEHRITRPVRAIDILNHPYTHDMRRHVNHTILSKLKTSLVVGLCSLLAILTFWFFKGRKSHNHKSLRGQTIVSPKRLKQLIQRARRASSYKIEDVPLIKDSETKHILSVGTTGAGKTNWFNELLPQLKQQKVLVVDTTGDMISKYYDESRGDIILNPFDARSASWDMVSECVHDYEFDDLSKAIIPSASHYQDPLWKNGAAKLLSVAMRKAKEEQLSLRELFSLISEAKLSQYGSFFAGTEAYPFADPKGEKTTMSFRSTLSSYTQFFKAMNTNTKTSISLKEWVQDEGNKSWIFITANENMLETLKPYMAAMVNIITTSLMSLSEDPNRRLWFIMDELPALQKIESLHALLSKGRKYGACVVGGIQSLSQFEEIYGHQGAKTILNLFNSKFFFRMEESSACDQISRWIGEEEIEESKEGLSYGAHQMRDGVSLNSQKSQRRLVLPTEIAQLKNLQCYVKLSGSFPVTKLDMAYNTIPAVTKSFVS